MTSPHPESEDDAADLRVLVARIIAGRWWINLSVLVISAAFTTAAFGITPIYRASTILIPAKFDHDAGSGGSSLGGIGGVASLVGFNLGGGDSFTEEAIAVLRSREFTDKFINDLNLMPVLYSKQWDTASGKWKVDEKNRPTPARAFAYFDRKIRFIDQEKKTSLMTLSVDWRERTVAARWANELVDRLNAEMRKREIARADSAVGYLEKEFDSTTAVATRAAISRLIEAQVKQRMLATVTPEFAFRVIDPAVPPDIDDRYYPNRIALIFAGPILGLLFGVVCVLGYGSLAGTGSRQIAA